MTFAQQFVKEVVEILDRIDTEAIERTAEIIAEVRQNSGRMFFIGVGGGAGHASHATCDFRKLAKIECYCPSDNVSELTARINDEGWETAYAEWLQASRFSARDMMFVFSVGGGDEEKKVSVNLVRAMQFAKSKGAKICAVVGREGGFAAQVADASVVIPVVNPQHITPHTEGLQAVVWHLLISHPSVKSVPTKWESLSQSL